MIKSEGLGDRLREERDRLGLNQTDFGLQVGVSRGTQKAYELGTGAPDVRYLVALEGMGVDVQYVLMGRRFSQESGGIDEVEQALIERYRSLNLDDKQSVYRIVSAMAEVTALSSS